MDTAACMLIQQRNLLENNLLAVTNTTRSFPSIEIFLTLEHFIITFTVTHYKSLQNIFEVTLFNYSIYLFYIKKK